MVSWLNCSGHHGRVCCKVGNDTRRSQDYKLQRLPQARSVYVSVRYSIKRTLDYQAALEICLIGGREAAAWHTQSTVPPTRFTPRATW
jgi:hypothetical protein